MSSSTKKSINHFSKLQLNQVQHLNAMIEARQSRSKSVAFRHEVLQKQNMKNYQNEYSRIRSHLEGSVMPHATREKVNSRAAHLRALGAKAVDNIV